jgi:hypothetical protein
MRLWIGSVCCYRIRGGEKEGGLPENLQEWLTYQQKLTEQSNTNCIYLMRSA